MSSGRITIVALIAAFNEQDVLEHVLDELQRQGVDVYFIDDGSTDRTRTIAEARLGRGVIGVESLPSSSRPAAPDAKFRWTEILHRKQQLAAELDADWFIHHDADEFRESPWPGTTLAEAIARVDRAGYNAIDFALLDFWPTDESFQPGGDVRESLRHFEPGHTWNARQIKCWKKAAGPVDLASNGGHDVQFPGRRVYPLRFILRHYPVRSTAHGHRKIFAERIPRFRDDERERGWHVQYESIQPGQSLARDATSLPLYDGAVVRRDLAAADIERLDEARAQLAEECGVLRSAVAQAHAGEHVALLREAEAGRKESEALQREREALDREALALEQAADARRADAAAQAHAAEASRRAQLLSEALDAANHGRADLERQLDVHRAEQRHLLREIQAIYSSASWRVTRPLRAVFARLFRY